MTFDQMSEFDKFQTLVKTLLDRSEPFASVQDLGYQYRADLAREGPLCNVSVHYEPLRQRWTITTDAATLYGVGPTLFEAHQDFRQQVRRARTRACERYDRLLEALP